MFNRKNSVQDMDAYVEERLSDYLDGTLSERERATVEAQLAQSERARASLDALRYTVSLLKQTPAPPLPRQFTLPVTSRAPAQAAPGWLVWSLRGVGAAATVAFVVLLVGTLYNQQNLNQGATASSARAVPSAVIAMAATSAPPLQEVPQNSANDANATPIMITVEPPAAAPQPLPVTETANAAASKAQTSQQDSSNIAPTGLPPTRQPTVKPEKTEAPEATVAAASASGVSSAAPELSAPTATSEIFTTRIAITLEGEIILSELKVREGPGTQYRTIGGLHLGDIVTILGKSHDEAWLLIDYPKNKKTHQGWISTPYVRLNGLLESLPIAELGEPEPETVTPTETETPTPVANNDSTDGATVTPTPTASNVTAEPPLTPVFQETKPAEGSPTPQAPSAATTGTPTIESASGHTPEPAPTETATPEPGSGRTGTQPSPTP